MEFVVEDVKSDKKVVAKAKSPKFATHDEAYKWLADEYCAGDLEKGKQYALDLITTQNATNIKNRLRAEATGEPSKTALRDKAMENLLKMADPEKPELLAQLRAIVSDPTKKEEWLATESNRLLEEHKARRAAAAAEVAQSEGNGDEGQE